MKKEDKELISIIFENVPKVTLSKTKNGMAISSLPNRKIQINKSDFGRPEGTYYGIYEICEIIDKKLKNNNTFFRNTETGNLYKNTEEIQKLLEEIEPNMFFRRNILPNDHGYYIHESKIMEILSKLNLEPELLTWDTNKKESIDISKDTEEIRRAQEEYVKNDTSPENYKNVKKGRIKTAICIALAATVLTGTIYMLGRNNQTDQIPEPTSESISLVEDEAVKEVTIDDLYKNIYVGQSYLNNETPLYGSSDATSKSGNTGQSTNTVTQISILKKDNNQMIILKTYDIDEYNGNIYDKLQELGLNNQSDIIVRAHVIGKTAYGWIDITPESYEELGNMIELLNSSQISKRI